jgi:hypothetical protein
LLVFRRGGGSVWHGRFYSFGLLLTRESTMNRRAHAPLSTGRPRVNPRLPASRFHPA